MRPVFPLALLLAVLPAAAADKELPLNRNSNELVDIDATLLLDRDQIRQAIGANVPGADLDGNFIGVRVTVRPVSDAPVKIWRDDFTLLSDRDGQRSTPFGPSQIAGASTMIVKTKPGATVGTHMDKVPIWSAGPIGGMGSSGTAPSPELQAEVKDGSDKKDSPLLLVLREKILPEKSITDPITGLLFFVIDGKVKPKNLELFYKTDNGKLGIKFAYK
jgi:hypothetical protein